MRRSVVVLLGVALGLRISAFVLFNVFLFKNQTFHPDTYIYHYGALHLQGVDIPERWRETIVHFLAIDHPYSFFHKKHGYIFFTWGLYSLFGSNLLVPALFNVFLGSFMVLIGYRLARQLFGEKTAFWSGALLALDPYLIYLSTQFLKDTWVVTLILASVYFYVRATQEKKPIFHLYNCLLLAFLGSLRPEFAFVLGGVFVLVTLGAWQRTWRFMFLYLMSLAFLVWVIAIPWTKELVIGVRREASAQVGAVEKSRSWLDKVSQLGDLPLASVNFARRISSAESHVPFYGNSLPKEPFTSYLDLVLKTPRQLAYLFLAPFPWEAHGRYERLFAFYMVWWYLVVPLFILGVWMSAHCRYSPMLLLIIMLLGCPLAYCVTMTSSVVRYRLALFVLVLVLAGRGLDYLISNYPRATRLRTLPAS